MTFTSLVKTMTKPKSQREGSNLSEEEISKMIMASLTEKVRLFKCGTPKKKKRFEILNLIMA